MSAEESLDFDCDDGDEDEEELIIMLPDDPPTPDLDEFMREMDLLPSVSETPKEETPIKKTPKETSTKITQCEPEPKPYELKVCMSDSKTIYTIQKFDPRVLSDARFNCLIAGPRRSGKSTCLKDLAWYMRLETDAASVLADADLEEYESYVRDLHGHRFGTNCELDTASHLSMIAASQDEKIGNIRASIIKNGHSPSNMRWRRPKHLIVIDGLDYTISGQGHESNRRNEEELDSIMCSSRHYGINVLATVQYAPKFVTREQRGLYDYVFLTKEYDAGVRKKIWCTFGGICKTFDVFDAILRAITSEPHTVMVIKVNGDSYDFHDAFFWYKAPPNRTPFFFAREDRLPAWSHLKPILVAYKKEPDSSWARIPIYLIQYIFEIAWECEFPKPLQVT